MKSTIRLLTFIAVLTFFNTCYSQLTVNSNGKVGIGASSPVSKLDILDNGPRLKFHDNSGYSQLLIANPGTQYAGIGFDAADGDFCGQDYFLLYQEDDKNFKFESMNGAGDIVFMTKWGSPMDYSKGSMWIKKNTGRVGIGTSNPTFLLDVWGDICTYGEVQISSDQRLKKEIVDLDEQKVHNLYNLQAKSYIRNKAAFEAYYGINSYESDTVELPEFLTDTTPKIGFLAQDLMVYYPNLVKQDNEGIYNIDYIALIPILVEALKEQKYTIDYLESELASLKAAGQGLKSVSSSDQITFADDTEDAVLFQNRPNPFNTDTEIKFRIPESVLMANLYILDMNGRMIKSYEIYDRGLVSIIITGYELRPGMYLYSLQADNKEVGTKRMILTEK